MSRTAEQELRFQGQMNRLRQGYLSDLAMQASVVLNRGRVFLQGCNAGVKPLQLAKALKRTVPKLRQAAELAETYERLTGADLLHGGYLAAACHGLDQRTIAACTESEAHLLKTLQPTGTYVQGIAAWQRLLETGEPPPEKCVAYHLSGFWGATLDGATGTCIAGRLAQAFPPGHITDEHTASLVARHSGDLMTPELATEFAAQAVKTFRQIPLSGTARGSTASQRLSFTDDGEVAPAESQVDTPSGGDSYVDETTSADVVD